MAIDELDAFPKIVGQYQDMRPQYNIPVPYPGAAVTWSYLGSMTIEEMEAWVEARKASFEADQLRTSDNPTRWVDVGYYTDLTDGLVYVNQFVMPSWTTPVVESEEE